ncbi:MAG: hypothetical protein KKB13_30080 [Chloroflexi bacterium]|nr:hypothetical protein [Chloroflexota bacterium]
MNPYLEVVNATVIGPFTKPYEFWTPDGRQIGRRMYLASDAEAEKWFKETYPDEYQRGVEMRCYDVGQDMPAVQLADGTLLGLSPTATVEVTRFPGGAQWDLTQREGQS